MELIPKEKSSDIWTAFKCCEPDVKLFLKEFKWKMKIYSFNFFYKNRKKFNFLNNLSFSEGMHKA